MSGESQRTFYDVLEQIRNEAENPRDLGTRFEEITKEFLVTDLSYKKRFKKVWMWNDWRYRASVSVHGKDVGVDLMAEEFDGSWCAIQCKCYKENNVLDYPKLTTFFTTVELINKTHKKKVNTVLVYTGDRTTAQTEKALEINNCHLIGQNEFVNSSVVWDNFPRLETKNIKELRPHQKNAFDNVISGLKTEDRGKLIMACGTGKTLTSLRIAEEHVGIGKTVLYLVPSISLIHQTMKEWSENAKIKHHYAVVCSDSSVGKNEDDKDEDNDITQLAFPATTDVNEIKNSFSKKDPKSMGVIFSTYHSIDVVSKAIDKKFDLVLCDEAHRTTGVEKDAPTYFTKVHHDKNISAKKRIYMTATPRVYGEALKRKENVSSMDDSSIYGENLHQYSFDKAVEDGQLSDFIVRIPILSAKDIEKYTDESIEGDADGTIDERVLLAAVWHGLNYDNKKRKPLLQRVISFSNKVKASKKFTGLYQGLDMTTDENKYAEKLNKMEDGDRIAADRSFKKTVEKYEKTSVDRTGNKVSVRHVDGTMRASIRNEKMKWLKESGSDPKECRILSNARCLSEGIDVPALDGVVFLQPRRSKTDVVQSVGRVMRKAEGKKYGYVILPVVVPENMTPEEALNDQKAWKTVWDVLNALRSHNPNFANKINRVALDRGAGGYTDTPENIEIIWMGSYHNLENDHELFGKIVTKMVEKVGDRGYYDNKSKELGEKSRDIRDILKDACERENRTVVDAVDELCKGLKITINDTVNEDATIDLLAQHHSLSKVFDVLFPREFRSSNPVVEMLDEAIERIGLQNELKEFEKFYDDVEKEASKFKHVEGKQEYIKKIYGNFMIGFDKNTQESSGIVYTPDEVIDFILHSVNHVLKKEFKTDFSKNDVKILDPFTGTGAFVAKLLESRLLKKNIKAKYKKHIWVNEISLLAYYVAAVNIETTYKIVTKSKRHLKFKNINFTDTLNQNPQYRLAEEHRKVDTKLDGQAKKIHHNIKKGNWSHVHVIIGNPPYSAKQSNYNKNSKNIKYSELDKRIKNTYAIKSTTNNTVSLRDSYIRSIRWASDRIGESGVIGFVTNSSIIHSEVSSGVRACLKDEFTDIWCLDLRGDGRNTGDGRNIFEYKSTSEGGTKTPVAIIILVKNPKKAKSTICYSRLDDKYYSGKNKRNRVKELKSIAKINDWQTIIPDKHHDWVNKRNDDFLKYIALGNSNRKRENNINSIFKVHSNGLKTHRDVWVYNSSKTELSQNMKKHIDYCNKTPLDEEYDLKFATKDSSLTDKLAKLSQKPKFDSKKIRVALYKPFFRQFLYFDKTFNGVIYNIPKLFPTPTSKNLVICFPGKGKKGKFSCIITDVTPDVNLISPTQCFPLYTYNGTQNDNMTDYALEKFNKFYKDYTITKHDIFYYIYGLLHHNDYKTDWANNLSKELPRIPLALDFWSFSNIGKKLADLHLSWSNGNAKKYSLGDPLNSFEKYKKITFEDTSNFEQESTPDKNNTNQKSGKITEKTLTLKINGITIFQNIPKTTYQVNGKTPLEWATERYKYKKDKDSDIINDSTNMNILVNGDIISLIERLVYVSVESDKLIKQLPKSYVLSDHASKNTGLDLYTDDTQLMSQSVLKK